MADSLPPGTSADDDAPFGLSQPQEPENPLRGGDTPPPDGLAADAGGTRNIPWPRLARQDYAVEPVSSAGSRTATGNAYELWMWITIQVCGLGLLLGGYLLGQHWAPRPRAGVTTGAVGSREAALDPQARRAGGERSLEAVSRALKAERSHDFQAAQAIYEEATKRHTPLAGAEYRLALIALHQGDFSQTEAHLNRSLSAGEAVGACCLLRASLAGMKGNYADASVQFATAARAEPFNAKFLFCWGETLRRDGRLADAVQRLTQTLDRPDNADARDLYLFKLRLAEVEAASDAVFDAELTDQTRVANPGGDWCLLAAARELLRKNESAAVGWLTKGKATLPPETYGTYLQDYLFQSRRGKPALAAALDVPPPTRNPPKDSPLEDPAVWTAAEADPAAWPPFTPVE